MACSVITENAQASVSGTHIERVVCLVVGCLPVSQLLQNNGQLSNTVQTSVKCHQLFCNSTGISASKDFCVC
jgi:hypothetical protein